MAWLAVIVILGAAAMGGISYKIMCIMDDRANKEGPSWINYLADQSRKKKEGKRRYLQWIGMGS